MNYPWLEDYCLAKVGATKDYKIEWECDRYLILDKMFGMQGEHPNGRPMITLKLEPLESDFLRQEYPDIIPGYYMNKTHWSTVFLDGEVPDEVLMKLIDESHRLIFSGLSKKKQAELLELAL